MVYSGQNGGQNGNGKHGGNGSGASSTPPSPGQPQKPKHPGGRPTKLTKARQDLLAENIRLGMTLKLACEIARIDFSTFRDWMLKGQRARRGKFAEFSKEIQKAEADALRGHLATITNAAKNGDWRASAWILERRHAKQFSRTRVELANARGDEDDEDSAPEPLRVVLDLAGKTTEDLAAELAKVRAARGAQRT